MASIVRSAFSISLRVTAKFLYVAHGVRVSHEHVRGREVGAGSTQVRAPLGVGSGVYACDERHLEILGSCRSLGLNPVPFLVGEALSPT